MNSQEDSSNDEGFVEWVLKLVDEPDTEDNVCGCEFAVKLCGFLRRNVKNLQQSGLDPKISRPMALLPFLPSLLKNHPKIFDFPEASRRIDYVVLICTYLLALASMVESSESEVEVVHMAMNLVLEQLESKEEKMTMFTHLTSAITDVCKVAQLIISSSGEIDIPSVCLFKNHWVKANPHESMDVDNDVQLIEEERQTPEPLQIPLGSDEVCDSLLIFIGNQITLMITQSFADGKRGSSRFVVSDPMVRTLWDAVILQLKTNFFFASFKMITFLLTFNYEDPAKMPEVIGRTVVFVANFLVGEGEPERPGRTREISALLLINILNEWSTPDKGLDKTFANIQSPVVVKFLQRLAEAVVQGDLDPVGKLLLNPVLRFMTALARVAGKFARVGMATGMGSLFVNVIDATLVCSQRHNTDRKTSCELIAHCILSDLNASKVTKWFIPETFNLTFTGSASSSDLTMSGAVKTTPTLNLIDSKLKQVVQQSSGPVDPSSARMIVESLAVVLLLLKEHQGNGTADAFALLSELFRKVSGSWTHRMILINFVLSTANESCLMEWLELIKALTVMAQFTKLDKKLLKLLVLLSSVPYLSQTESEGEDLPLYAEHWSKLVGVRSRFENIDAVKKCLSVISCLPSHICPIWRKRVMKKTHLEKFSGSNGLGVWMENIPFFAATMESAVECIKAIWSISFEDDPHLLELRLDAMGQLLCLQSGCAQFELKYPSGSRVSSTGTIESLIHCSVSCTGAKAPTIVPQAAWLQENFTSQRSDEYVCARKAGCRYLVQLLRHCKVTSGLENFIGHSAVLLFDPSMEVKTEYSRCLGLIAKRELVTKEVQTKLSDMPYSMEGVPDFDTEHPVVFHMELAKNTTQPEVLEQSVTALAVIVLNYEFNRFQSSLAMQAIHNIAAHRGVKPQDLLLDAAECVWPFAIRHITEQMKMIGRAQEIKQFVTASLEHLALSFGYSHANGDSDVTKFVTAHRTDIMSNIMMVATSEASNLFICIVSRFTGTNRQRLIARHIAPIFLAICTANQTTKTLNEMLDFMVHEGNTENGNPDEQLGLNDYLNYDFQNILFELLLHISVNRENMIGSIVKILGLQTDSESWVTINSRKNLSMETKVLTHIHTAYGLIGLIIKFEATFKNPDVRRRKRLVVLKSFVEFLQMAGGKLLTQVRMKVMAVLRLVLSEKDSELKKLSCTAWREFVKNLQPECLPSMLPHIVVAILPLTKLDLNSWTPLLTDIFVTRRERLKNEIDQLGFILNVPEWSHLAEVLRNVNAAETKMPLQERIQRCLKVMESENPDVKVLALAKLLNVLELNQRDLNRLILDSDVIDDFICSMMNTLVKTIRYDSAEVKRLTAKCLGLIGAIDPGKLDVNSSDDSSVRLGVSSDDDFSTDDASPDFPVQMLMELARVLSSVSHGNEFNVCSFVLQEVLKYFRCTVLTVKDPTRKALGYKIWSELPENVRDSIESMLSSKYSVKLPAQNVTVNRTSFLNWIESWLALLISKVKRNDRRMCYLHCSLLVYCDTNLGVFLIPHVILTLLLTPAFSRVEVNQIVEEILTVLKSTVASKNTTEVDRSSSQVIFSVIDYLSHWLTQKRKIASSHEYPESRKTQYHVKIAIVDSFLTKIPQKLLSEAAFACHNYTRSLRHLECHIQQKTGDNGATSQQKRSEAIQQEIPFLQEIYACLDETDNVWGALDIRKQLREPSYREQILAYESTGNFTEALPFHDLASKAHPESVEEQKAQINCLLKLNQPYIAFNCASQIMETHPEWNEQLIAHRMEAAWKLQDWKGLEDSLATTQLLPSMNNSWELTVGQLLLAANNKDVAQVQQQLAIVRDKLISGFSTANMEGSAYERAYKYVCRMHSVTEIEQFFHCHLVEPKSSTALTAESLVETWRDRQKLVQRSCKMLEPILEMRRSLLGIAHGNQADLYRRESAYLWLQSAKVARKAGHLQSAWSYLANAKEFPLPENFVEEAKLYTLKNQSERAIATLNNGIREHYGHIDEAFKKKETEEAKKKLYSFAKAQIHLAKYSLQASAKDYKGTYNMFNEAFATCSTCEETNYAVATYIDSGMLRGTSKNTPVIGQNLLMVIQHYATSLEYGSHHLHHSMPRLLTLWLDYGLMVQTQMDKRGSILKKSTSATALDGSNLAVLTPFIAVMRELNKLMLKTLVRIPIYHFYTALSQLLSRLCHPNEEVTDTLIKVIARVIAAYPERALWQCMVVARSKHTDRSTRGRDAIKMASTLNNSVNTIYGSMQKLVTQLSTVCADDSDGSVLSVRKKFPALGKLSGDRSCRNILIPFQKFINVMLPTAVFGEKQDLNYNPFVKQPVYIDSFKDEVMILSSMKRPKRLSIVGTDGLTYHIMCKPTEDLRQDSRLMELNALVNSLLRRDQEARRRRLYVRTYNVVPLSEENGIIEWVPNLKGLRPIVVGLIKEMGKGMKQSVIMDLLEPKKASPSERVKSFTEVLLPAHPPMLSEWFRRSFPDPSQWYVAISNFIHTTAVMSILGFVLGLGDRHGENINLDATTGDVFHVDFNCLFNSGVKLQQPEVVPFRLTQAMVEAMGPMGTEGMFRRSCEVTMRVLRNNKDVLQTVLASFMHDPMSDWLVKERKATPSAQGRQGQSNATHVAVLHLNNIEKRLDGQIKHNWDNDHDKGYVGPLSVEAQVGELIKQATDPNLLGLMYHGWCAYL